MERQVKNSVSEEHGAASHSVGNGMARRLLHYTARGVVCTTVESVVEQPPGHTTTVQESTTAATYIQTLTQHEHSARVVTPYLNG